MILQESGEVGVSQQSFPCSTAQHTQQYGVIQSSSDRPGNAVADVPRAAFGF